MPYTHIGEHVDLRITQTSLEVWKDDQRLASHRLLPATAVNQYSTREADLRSVDLAEQRGLDRSVLAELGACGFVTAHRNIVVQGFTGSGKSYLASAIAKAACTHRYRAHLIRMPDLAEAWRAAGDRPQGASKLIKKYAASTVLVLYEWLLDSPDEAVRTMLLELMERRYDTTSTAFCTQYAQKDWHHRLGGGVHADAIMDRIVHNTTWINTGQINMRGHATTGA